MLGDLNHDGSRTNTEVKTEWRPLKGISEDLSNYVTSERAHRYAECSNAGLCDRSKGDCMCFPGFEGSACQRRSCPSDIQGKMCNGHGSCVSSNIIIHDKYKQDDPVPYAGWETEKFYSCICDKGWEGVDCNSRKCPIGFDPLLSTSPSTSTTVHYTIKQNELSEKNYYIFIEYDDIIYKTPIIRGVNINDNSDCGSKEINSVSLASAYAEEIKRAIRIVPPLVQSRVQLKCNGSSVVIDITVDYLDVIAYESSEIKVTYQEGDEEKTIVADKTDLDKTYQQIVCSGRGLCNPRNGLCECFQGYHGASCENQRTVTI